MTLQEIKLRLFSLPQEIKEARENLNETNSTEDAEFMLKNIEAEYLLIVSQEKDNGKPKYSNEAMRQAAIRDKMNLDPNALKQREQIKNGQKAKAEASANLEALQNEFRAIRTIAQLDSSAATILAELFGGGRI